MVCNFRGAFAQEAFGLVALLFLSDALGKMVIGIDFGVEKTDCFDSQVCVWSMDVISVSVRNHTFARSL